MVFPVFVSSCESWTIKKTEHQWFDAFKSWCWRRLLRVSGTARISNKSIIKEINPEYSLEGLLLELKLQYFGYLMWRPDLLEKTLMLWNIEGKRKRDWQRMKWLGSITDSMDMNLSKLWARVNYWEAWLAAIHGVAKSHAWFGEWTATVLCVHMGDTQGKMNNSQKYAKPAVEILSSTKYKMSNFEG